MRLTTASGADSHERKRRPILGIERHSENSLLAGFEDHFSSAEIAEAQAWGAALCRARNTWDLRRKGGGHGFRR